MKKLISILTLCLVTSFSMTSPIAASTVQPDTQNSDNVNVVSDLSDTYLCLNQNASMLNGLYLNGSCMKVQPKCNSTVINSFNLQQIISNNAFCQKLLQQYAATNADGTTGTDVTTATKSAQNELSATTPTLATGTETASDTKATTCQKSDAQSVTCSKNKEQSNACNKSNSRTDSQKSTCPNKGTKETQKSEENTSTQAPTAATPVNTSNSSFEAFQKKIVLLVNNERAAAGLNALSENSGLDNVATLKSEDMVKLDYFSHTSPTYGSPFQMLTQFNISYTAAGENIAYGQPTPEDVMNGWMNSPGHRANILNVNYTQIGVGIAQKSNGQYVWTQEFSRP